MHAHAIKDVLVLLKNVKNVQQDLNPQLMENHVYAKIPTLFLMIKL